MLSPKTYHGYNSEGKCIASCTALDANTLIDPAEVQAALNNLENVFNEEMGRIASSLRQVDASDAVIVQGASMSGVIQDTAAAVTQIPGQVSSSFQGLYGLAVQAHDTLQQQANDEARSAVNRSGVVRVTGG